MLLTDSECFGSLFVLVGPACDCGIETAVVGVTGSGVCDIGDAARVCGGCEDACDCLRDRIRASCAD